MGFFVNRLLLRAIAMYYFRKLKSLPQVFAEKLHLKKKKSM